MSQAVQNFLFEFDAEYVSRNEFFEEISKQLIEKKYVVDDYCNELSKREDAFPTALKTRHVNIAIPHTNAEFVNESFIYFCRLKDPIYFDEMSGEEGSLPVNLIFVLGIHKDENQIKLLQSLMELFMDEDSVKFISESNELQIIKDIIRRKI